jgi:heme-degrading monooxygenase HmoA
MFARVTTFQGSPDRIEEGIRIYREQVIPWLRDSTGFRGWLALLDRDNERALGVTFWTSEQAMTDGEAGGAALRDEVAAGVGAVMESMAFYEIAAAESILLDDAR